MDGWVWCFSSFFSRHRTKGLLHLEAGVSPRFGGHFHFVVYRRASFPLTPLTFISILHGVIRLIGRHDIHTDVTLGSWMRDLWDLGRNHDGRLDYSAQECVPAILTRKILLRRSSLVTGKRTLFMLTAMSLAFGALYDLFGWVTGRPITEGNTAFLETPGDEWDMFLASICIWDVTSQITFQSIHNRQLTNMR